MTHLLVMICVGVVAIYGLPGAAPLLTVDPRLAVFVPPLSLALMWLLTHSYIAHCGRRLDRSGDARSAVRAERAAERLRVMATIVHAAGVLALGEIGAVVELLGLPGTLARGWVLLQVLAIFVLTFWSLYPIERRLSEASLWRSLHGPRPLQELWPRWQSVWYAVRHQILIVLIPAGAIWAWNVALGLAVDPAWPWMPAAQLLGVAVIFALLPLLLRAVWDTIPLGDGPLRDELIATCRRHKVRVRSLLVWRTGGAVVNAAVMGVFGFARFLLLSDAMIQSLPQDQLRAVVLHEIAHIRRHHLIWLALALVAAVLLPGTVLARMLPWMPQLNALAAWLLPLTLLFAIFVLGIVSRRFEWQADAFAASELSLDQERIDPEAAATMGRTLRSVAELNGVSPERFSWRHGSIALRIRRLEGLRGVSRRRLRIDREVRTIQLVTLAVLAACLLDAALA